MQTYPLVVLANEPCSYRSLLADELPLLRPNLRVLEVHPAELETTVATLHPSVVICSRALEQGDDAESSILLLYAEELETFIQTGDGTLVNPRLSDILGAIDRAVCASHPVSVTSTAR
jgi:hypothetical protein